MPVEETGLAAPGVEGVGQVGCDLQVLYTGQSAVSLDAAVNGEELWLAAPAAGREPVAVLDSDQNVAAVVWPDGGLNSLQT